MTNRISNFATALGALVLAASPATAAELIANGGFEAGDFAGWTVTGSDTDYIGVGGGWVNSGNYAAYFGSVGSISSISQSLSTVAGQSYEISFYLQNGVSGTNSFDVFFGGGPAAISYDSLGQTPWTRLSFSTIATAADTLLQFSFRNDPSLFYLDDVSVTSAGLGGPVSAAPEPESWAMMIVGFGLVGFALRTSKRKSSLSVASSALR